MSIFYRRSYTASLMAFVITLLTCIAGWTACADSLALGYCARKPAIS